MSISLFQHNEEAYQAAVSMLSKIGKAAIIHPIGTGKSFIGFKLCEEQIKKLGSVGIKANISRGDLTWEEQYAEAKRFYETHGHLTVPKGYVGKNGKSLGRWLQLQRTNSKHHKLSDERMMRLNEIGFR